MSFEPSSVMTAGGPALELQWVFRALWRRRLLAGAIFGAVLLLVGVYTAVATPLYEATSLLLVKIGREYVYQAEVGEGTGQILPRSRETLINSEIQILRSAEVVKAVVEEMGVEALYPSLALDPPPGQPIESVAAARFLANLRVRAVEDADVIQVSLLNTDPQVTARAVNLLVERFKEAHLQAFGEGQAMTFLEEQAAKASEELKLAETGLLEFQAQHPQFSLENKDQLLLAEHTQLETALRDVENQIVGARQRSLTSGPPVPSAQEQLLQLQLQERKLLNTHNEDSRQVQNVRREIELVKGFLADEAKNHSGKHGEELAILTARKKALEERLAQIEGDLGSLPALSARYRELQRKVDGTEATYKRATSRLENARSSAEMDRQKLANISVIQPAYAPLQPVSPRPMLNLIVAVVIGGGLAVGAALAMERLSPSV
jgi:polysaccharide biosynthesis protein PslE